MKTAWGNIPVHDAHVHFLSHNFFSQLGRQKGGMTVEAMGQALGWEMPPEDPSALAARWVEELDRYGVERAVLIASLPGDEPSVAAAVAAYPDRFYGYFLVNPCEDGAAARAGRALAEHHLRGICLFPAMHRYSLHDERLTPVYELAAATPGAVVFVHCGVLTVGVRTKLALPSPFDMRYSNPLDLHAIALRYPAVKFVVPHFGAGFFREALMLCDLCPNVCLDTSSSNSWTRYQPGRPDLRAVFEQAIEVVGPHRLLFGTDSSFFPRGWHRQIFDLQTGIHAAMGVSREDAEAILGGNLARLLATG